MKRLRYMIIAFIALVAGSLSSCYSDEGNYDYKTEEEAGVIKIDTVGIANRMALSYNLNPGDHIEFEPNVTYSHPERLRYRWFVLTLTQGRYQSVQNGNIMEYPPADTIGYAKKLDWTVNLKPGYYRFYMMAEDSITGMRAYYQAEEQYTMVNESDKVSGLCLLSEREGNTTLEFYGSPLMLIYGDTCIYDAYHKLKSTYLEGKPRWIHGTHTGKTSKDGYLVATDKNLYRINSVGLDIMNDWSNMFYDTPENFNPETSFYTNNCDFLINDGKLHVLYANKANDRKFSAPIAGDYEAAPYLMYSTMASWRPVTGAINAYQVIYDEKNKRFRPYFSNGTSVTAFKGTNGDAYLDANKLPSDPKFIFNGGGNETCCIMEDGSDIWLYRFLFYNVVDDGDLSNGGDRAKINLNGCTDIKNAKFFAACTGGYAFYYATDNAVYSFSTSSGQDISNTIYTCESGEEVTAIYAYGSAGGGWPTSNCIFWIATWNEGKKEGKLIQYEVDNNYGVPQSMWGPMLGAGDENPVITTGWGKIVGMTCLDAE